jgi:hypothetical protein
MTNSSVYHWHILLTLFTVFSTVLSSYLEASIGFFSFFKVVTGSSVLAEQNFFRFVEDTCQNMVTLCVLI